MPPVNRVHLQIGAGTDTNYSPSRYSDRDVAPAPPGYDFYETLSLINDAVDASNHPAGVPEPIPTHHGAPLQALNSQISSVKVNENTSQSVTYVNGPSTLGTDVGANVVQNLIGILDALNQGKQIINVIAHSRGGCATLLVLHELQAIKENTDNTIPLYTLLLKTPCLHTKKYLTDNKAILETKLNSFISASTHLQTATFNLFAIDPVPGGSWYGTKGWTRWRDKRFFTLPELVSEAEFVFYENERTRCFKAICPKPTNPRTKLTKLNLPGHHGTGSGNLADQQRTTDFDDMKTKTRPIQRLLTLKLTRFLQKHGVKFKPAFLEEMLPTPKAQLALYREIMSHRSAYARFNTTTYAYLGSEQGWWNIIPRAIREYWFGVEDKRIIHEQEKTDSYLTAVTPPIEGFVNKEHFELEIAALFELLDQEPLEKSSPVMLLQSFTRNLTDHIERLASQEERLNHIPQGVIHLICQQYLKNHLTRDEKTTLLQAIGEFFAFLNRPAGPTVKRLKEHIERQAKDAFIETMMNRFDMLASQTQDALKVPLKEEGNEPSNTHLRSWLIEQCNEFLETIPSILELCEEYQIDVTKILPLRSLICRQLHTLLGETDDLDPLWRKANDERDKVRIAALKALYHSREEPLPPLSAVAPRVTQDGMFPTMVANNSSDDNDRPGEATSATAAAAELLGATDCEHVDVVVTPASETPPTPQAEKSSPTAATTTQLGATSCVHTDTPVSETPPIPQTRNGSDSSDNERASKAGTTRPSSQNNSFSFLPPESPSPHIATRSSSPNPTKSRLSASDFIPLFIGAGFFGIALVVMFSAQVAIVGLGLIASAFLISSLISLTATTVTALVQILTHDEEEAEHAANSQPMKQLNETLMPPRPIPTDNSPHCSPAIGCHMNKTNDGLDRATPKSS